MCISNPIQTLNRLTALAKICVGLFGNDWRDEPSLVHPGLPRLLHFCLYFSPRPHDSVLMDGWRGVGSFFSLTLFPPPDQSQFRDGWTDWDVGGKRKIYCFAKSQCHCEKGVYENYPQCTAESLRCEMCDMGTLFRFRSRPSAYVAHSTQFPSLLQKNTWNGVCLCVWKGSNDFTGH